jgi:hypothetical protein
MWFCGCRGFLAVKTSLAEAGAAADDEQATHRKPVRSQFRLVV